MQVEIVSSEEYELLCGEPNYFFNSATFHRLNSEKVENVVYLLFKENKNLLALALGICTGEIKIPYSAPFGIFEQLHNHIRIEDIEQALKLLEEYAQAQGIRKIMFRIPPAIYDESFISKIENCVLRREYQIESCDLNYFYYLGDVQKYEEGLFRNAKKNLKRAKKEEFVFQKCETETEWEEAYEVIKENRKRRGFPLKMSYEQVVQTSRLTNSEAFLLKLKNANVAAAIVFGVSDKVKQVIYWGDIGGYELQRPMNMLAYKIYEYYAKGKIQILDIGPSTEDGIPNYGLCDYKESIGCSICTKYTYTKLLGV